MSEFLRPVKSHGLGRGPFLPREALERGGSSSRIRLLVMRMDGCRDHLASSQLEDLWRIRAKHTESGLLTIECNMSTASLSG